MRSRALFLCLRLSNSGKHKDLFESMSKLGISNLASKQLINFIWSVADFLRGSTTS